MNVVKTDIKPEDVSKVMKEYDKKEVGKVVAPDMEKLPVGSLNDAVKAAQKKLDLRKGEPVVAKGSKSKAVEKLKEKHKEPEKPGEPKKVVIDMTTPETKVTFTGKNWIPMDIKLANAALIRAFRIKIRDEYRKGNK